MFPFQSCIICPFQSSGFSAMCDYKRKTLGPRPRQSPAEIHQSLGCFFFSSKHWDLTAMRISPTSGVDTYVESTMIQLDLHAKKAYSVLTYHSIPKFQNIT